MKFGKQTIVVGLIAVFSYAGPLNAGNMQAYFQPPVGGGTLDDINAATAATTVPPAYTTCATPPPTNKVFGVGFTSGLAYNGAGVLYGLNWSGGAAGSPIFLHTFSAGPCATGTNVGAVAVGPVNLESLAFCAIDGLFYSVDWDATPPHQGQLLSIVAATGIGTLIGGHLTFDRRVVGMVCDATGQLWAVTSGFATKGSELLKINRTTGVETPVGSLGLAPNEVESLAAEPGDTTKLFAAGKGLHEINKTTGAAGPKIGAATYAQYWAMAGTATATPVELLEFSVD